MASKSIETDRVVHGLAGADRLPHRQSDRSRPPILVIGMSRSGTKWLSNIICNHPDVVGAQSERHCGIIETNILGSAIGAFDDLTQIERYVCLVEAWSKTDFFRAIGGDANLLYSADPRPTTVLGVFQLAMDDFRDRTGAQRWVQKTNPHWGSVAAEAFLGCDIVIIHRSFGPHLRSSIQLHRTVGVTRSLSHAAAAYAFQEGILKRIAKRHRVHWIEFDDLKHDRETETRKLCKYLDIDVVPDLFVDRFRKNTSFVNNAERLGVLRRRDDLWSQAVYCAARWMPTLLYERYRHFFRPRSLEIVRGTYAELCAEHGIDSRAA